MVSGDKIVPFFETNLYRFGNDNRNLSLSLPAPSDYTSLTTSVIFPAGITEMTVVILISQDTILEELESFLIEMTPLTSGVTVHDSIATVFIEDNDGEYIGCSA